FSDWSAHLGAELISFERRRGRREERPRIEIIVAHELEGATMEFVGPALRHRVDGRAPIAPELGAVGVGLNGELLNRIRVREWKRRVEVRILIFATVERIHVGSTDPAVDGIARGARSLVEGTGGNGAGNQHLKLQNVAAVEGEFRNPHPVEGFADDAGTPFY